MSIIIRKGIIRGGQIVVEEPIDLPEGSELTIAGIPSSDACSPVDNGRLTPEEISATLAAMEKIEPFEMTPEEEAAWERDRLAQREWEKAHFFEWSEQLRRMWE